MPEESILRRVSSMVHEADAPDHDTVAIIVVRQLYFRHFPEVIMSETTKANFPHLPQTLSLSLSCINQLLDKRPRKDSAEGPQPIYELPLPR
jgi:hypothetical protein